MAYTNDSIWKSVDWMTICIYLMLVVFGWFSVCGASYDYGEIDFLVSTLVQENNLYGSVALWGSDLS